MREKLDFLLSKNPCRSSLGLDETPITRVNIKNCIVCYTIWDSSWVLRWLARPIRSELTFFSVPLSRRAVFNKVIVSTCANFDDSAVWAWKRCFEALAQNRIAKCKIDSDYDWQQVITSLNKFSDLEACAGGGSTATSWKIDQTVATGFTKLDTDKSTIRTSSSPKECWQLERCEYRTLSKNSYILLRRTSQPLLPASFIVCTPSAISLHHSWKPQLGRNMESLDRSKQ